MAGRHTKTFQNKAAGTKTACLKFGKMESGQQAVLRRRMAMYNKGGLARIVQCIWADAE